MVLYPNKLPESERVCFGICIKEAQEENTQRQPYSDIDLSIIKSMMKQIYRNQILDGLTPEQARLSLKYMEPFNEYEDLIDEL